jgi:hypothetical protein
MTGSPPPSLPKQTNLVIAVSRGIEALKSQSDEQLAWLGAQRDERGRICLTVLGNRMNVDLDAGGVFPNGGEPVDMRWQVLVVHYLAAPAPIEPAGGEMVFADIPETRGYQGVYDGRVIKRLCFTVGRTADLFQRGAAAIGGTPCQSEGDLAFRLEVLPRIPLRIVWYAGDEDFPPNAVFLFQPNVVHLLPPEDIIVLSELVVGAMAKALR